MTESDRDFFANHPEHLRLYATTRIKQLEKQYAAEFAGQNLTQEQLMTRVEEQARQDVHSLLSTNPAPDPKLLSQWRGYVEKQEHAQQQNAAFPVAALHPEVLRQAKEIGGIASSKPGLREILSSPESDKNLNDALTRIYKNNPLEHADAALASSVNTMMGDLRNHIAKVVPNAAVTIDVRAYVEKNDSPNIHTITVKSHDGQSATMGVVFTTGMLKENPDPKVLKAFMAHELAHEAFEANPQLKYDPRFQPTSQAFKDELARLKDALQHHPLTEKEREYMNAHFDDPAKKAAYIQQRVNAKIEIFTNEARADKFALWINPDSDSAQHMVADVANSKNKNVRDYQAKPIEEIAAIDPRPHPTHGVREEENRNTMREIENSKNPAPVVATVQPQKKSHAMGA